MIARAALLGLCSAAAACTSQPDDPQGTYRLAISLRSLDLTLVPDQKPLPISWIQTTDLTLTFDAAGRAQVELLGEQTVVSLQMPVVTGGANLPPGDEVGALQIQFDSGFMARVDDVIACPQTNIGNLDGFFDVFFLNGHVRGATVGVASCWLPALSNPTEGFILDVTGDRIFE